MPIYSYRCDECGHAKDVLQKMSDALLTVCPACGAPAFKKQLTAAGFQLKGSGWYVTDFRDGNKEAKKSPDKSADLESEKSADKANVESAAAPAKAPDSAGNATPTAVAAPATAAAATAVAASTARTSPSP